MEAIFDLKTWCMTLPENWKSWIPVLQHCNQHVSTNPPPWQTPCLSSNSVRDSESEALGQTWLDSQHLSQGFQSSKVSHFEVMFQGKEVFCSDLYLWNSPHGNGAGSLGDLPAREINIPVKYSLMIDKNVNLLEEIPNSLFENHKDLMFLH